MHKLKKDAIKKTTPSVATAPKPKRTYRVILSAPQAPTHVTLEEIVKAVEFVRANKLSKKHKPQSGSAKPKFSAAKAK